MSGNGSTLTTVRVSEGTAPPFLLVRRVSELALLFSLVENDKAFPGPGRFLLFKENFSPEFTARGRNTQWTWKLRDAFVPRTAAAVHEETAHVAVVVAGVLGGGGLLRGEDLELRLQ